MGPTTEDKQLRGQQAAEQLIGTGLPVNEILSEEEMTDEVIMEELAEHAFQCPECDWWCEACEATEDGRCNSCNQEED